MRGCASPSAIQAVAAERQLAALEPDIEEWRVAQADIDYFRAEYQRVARARAARQDRPGAAPTSF